MGIGELLLGVYANLPLPIALSFIYGGGLSALRDSFRKYNKVKPNWKPVYLIRNFVALFLIWQLAQSKKLSAVESFALNQLSSEKVEECSDTVASGIVIRLEPPSASTTTAGSVVKVITSTGPCVSGPTGASEVV